jgi:hypothetical protein
MDVTKIALDQNRARELYRQYKDHRHYATPVDDEIRRTYRLISQGKVVIQALDSIIRAGLGNDGLPKLAIARATERECICQTHLNGSCTMSGRTWQRGRGRKDDRITFARGSFEFPRLERQWRHPTHGMQIEYYTKNGTALVPLIPLHLRPRQALDQYHVLWEAEWTPVPPVDPYLLRRIGDADLWVVVAAWDLTDVERAALATRVSAN